jgi:WD40 repeat protein
MSESTWCEHCGSPLEQSGELGKHCPRCLLELGFESSAETLTEDFLFTDRTSPGRIGRYRLLRVIGQGGMGVVYEAEQDQPRRPVALKIIKPGMANPELLRRFEQESQALGRLQHPGIAQIYEAGTVDTGFGPQPYFAMELIHGPSARTYVDVHQLDTSQRLKLIIKICEAVQHAHQRGLIHRDLKPGNILIDENGMPKVLDFGVARVTDSDSKSTQTDVGWLVGTVAYMSPEQVLADPLDIDTRSDVYSLGVIYFELLAGRLPYPISKKVHETIQTIREKDPIRLGSVNRDFRGDIETIAGKALEKNRDRRYASAAEMAADIQRHLDHEPIAARPPSAGYQLRKFAQRNRALVTGIAAVFIALVAGVGIATRYANQLQAALERAYKSEASEKHLRLNETALRQVKEAALINAQEATAAKERALAASELSLYHDSINLADRESQDSNINRSDAFLDHAPASLRNWEYYFLLRRNHMEDATMTGASSPIRALTIDPDGNQFHTVDDSGMLMHWNIGTGTHSRPESLGDQRSVPIYGLNRSIYGRTVFSATTAVSSGGFITYTLKFWDLMTGRELLSFPGTLPSNGPITDLSNGWEPAAAVSRDGDVVAAVLNNGQPRERLYTLQLWESATGRKLRDHGVYSAPINSLFFNSNTTRLAVVQEAWTNIFDITGRRVSTLENSQGGTSARAVLQPDEARGNITALTFSADDELVIASFRDGKVREWTVADGKQRWSVSPGNVAHLAFSPDSRWIAAALTDQTIRILDSATGREAARLTGHTGAIHVLTFTPDSTQLVSAGNDKLIHVWNMKHLATGPTLTAGRNVSPMRVSPDGRSLLIFNASGIRSWNMDAGRIEFEQPLDAGRRETDVSADGRRILTMKNISTSAAPGPASGISELQVLDGRTGREIAVFRPPNQDIARRTWAYGFRISSDGNRAALVTDEVNTDSRQPRASDVYIWDIATRQLLTTLHLVNAYSGSIRLSRDGRLVAIPMTPTPGNYYSLDIFDATSGRRLRRIPLKEALSKTVFVFSPDGKRLVGAGNGITIWDVQTGAKLVSVSTFDKNVVSIGFSPNGTRLVSVSSDGEAWLWDTSTGSALIPLRDFNSPYVVREVTFIDDRYALTGQPIADPKKMAIAFSPDGNKIIRSSVEVDLQRVTVRVATWDGTPVQRKPPR